MARYAVRVFYDGRAYSGFQVQKQTRTVAGEILGALVRSRLVENLADARLQAASRTDTRASALSQTVAFSSRHKFSVQRLNAYLPSDIIAWAWAEVPDDFDPRREASARQYVYALPNIDYNLQSMTTVAQELLGTHDFHNFTPNPEKPCIKTLDQLSLRRTGSVLLFNFTSKSFARGMIRKIVHHLSEVGTGIKSPDDTRRLLDPGFCLRPGLPMAPAEFLLLAQVDYALSFNVDFRSLRLLKRKLLMQQALGELARTAYSLLQ